MITSTLPSPTRADELGPPLPKPPVGLTMKAPLTDEGEIDSLKTITTGDSGLANPEGNIFSILGWTGTTHSPVSGKVAETWLAPPSGRG